MTPKLCQNEFNDLVCDLNLSKELSELLASRLDETNFLLLNLRIFLLAKNESKLLESGSQEFERYERCVE